MRVRKNAIVAAVMLAASFGAAFGEGVNSANYVMAGCRAMDNHARTDKGIVGQGRPGSLV